MEKFFQRLKRERISSGMKQVQAAKFLKIHPNTYQSYERGYCYPPLERLVAISAMLNLSIDYLTCRTDINKFKCLNFQNLALNLKTMRMKQGCTQKKIAEALGISTVSYQNYELNTRTPSYQHFIALADFFQTSCDALLM